MTRFVQCGDVYINIDLIRTIDVSVDQARATVAFGPDHTVELQGREGLQLMFAVKEINHVTVDEMLDPDDDGE